MTEQIVFMSPRNGALCVGTPLYPRHYDSTNSFGYEINLIYETQEPLAYILDIGTVAKVFSAEWVHLKLIALDSL